MVTEELHSITFEAQICLYGLTIDLEVGVSRNIHSVLLTSSAPVSVCGVRPAFSRPQDLPVPYVCFNLENQYLRYLRISQRRLFWLSLSDENLTGIGDAIPVSSE